MKTLLLISLLAGASYADSCYLFQRGTDDWASCKDQAADNTKRMDEINSNMQGIINETGAAQATEAQTEDQTNALRAILANQQQDQGGNQ